MTLTRIVLLVLFVLIVTIEIIGTIRQDVNTISQEYKRAQKRTRVMDYIFGFVSGTLFVHLVVGWGNQ